MIFGLKSTIKQLLDFVFAFFHLKCIIKQLLDSVFVICKIINVSVRVIILAFGSATNSYLDIDNFHITINLVSTSSCRTKWIRALTWGGGRGGGGGWQRRVLFIHACFVLKRTGGGGRIHFVLQDKVSTINLIQNSWEICHRCAKILLAAEHKKVISILFAKYRLVSEVLGIWFLRRASYNFVHNFLLISVKD